MGQCTRGLADTFRGHPSACRDRAGSKKSGPKLKPKLSVDPQNNTLLNNVDLPTRIHRVLAFYGVRTVGELRETPEAMLLTFQDLGAQSVAYIRENVHLEKRK